MLEKINKNVSEYLLAEKTFYEKTEKGIVLRIRLTPAAAQSSVRGVFCDADGEMYLKISVVSVPEKGKANKELIKTLAKKLKIAKSEIELISGETSHYKKLLINHAGEDIFEQIKMWYEESANDSSDN